SGRPGAGAVAAGSPHPGGSGRAAAGTGGRHPQGVLRRQGPFRNRTGAGHSPRNRQIAPAPGPGPSACGVGRPGVIQHHPSEATLAAYAAGTLPQALALVAGTHLARCRICRGALSTLEATGGALLEDLAPAPLSIEALNLVLGRLDEPPPAPAPLLNPDLPAPLNRVAFGRWWPV